MLEFLKTEKQKEKEKKRETISKYIECLKGITYDDWDSLERIITHDFFEQRKKYERELVLSEKMEINDYYLR